MPIDRRFIVLAASRAATAAAGSASQSTCSTAQVASVLRRGPGATFFSPQRRFSSTTTVAPVPTEKQKIEMFAGRIFFLLNSPQVQNKPALHVACAFTDYKGEDFSSVKFNIPTGDNNVVPGNALHYVAATGAHPEVLKWLLETAGFRRQIEETVEFKGQKMTAIEIIASRVKETPEASSSTLLDSRLLDMMEILKHAGANVSPATANVSPILTSEAPSI